MPENLQQVSQDSLPSILPNSTGKEQYEHEKKDGFDCSALSNKEIPAKGEIPKSATAAFGNSLGSNAQPTKNDSITQESDASSQKILESETTRSEQVGEVYFTPKDEENKLNFLAERKADITTSSSSPIRISTTESGGTGNSGATESAKLGVTPPKAGENHKPSSITTEAIPGTDKPSSIQAVLPNCQSISVDVDHTALTNGKTQTASLSDNTQGEAEYRNTKSPEIVPWGTPMSEPPPLLDAIAIAAFNLSERRNDGGRHEHHGTDTDSALGDMSYASSMTSVTSSIYESVNENGRTYHSYKSGKYVLPNDVREQGRLDTQHYMLCEAIGGRLYRCPLDPHRMNRVLDIATGTGIWAMEFADDFPNAEVIGTDLTPIQPRWCPPNCRFEVDDTEDDWVFPAPFSYIHGRALLSCFEDPKDVIFKCVANLEPGGWLEFQDGIVPFNYEGPNAPPAVLPFDDKVPESVMQRWEKLTLEASIKGGRPWNNVQYYESWFKEAGLVDVTVYKAKLPLGTWDGLSRKEKRMGMMQFSNMYHGMEGMTVRNLARLDWTYDESKALVEEVRKEMLSRRYRPCTTYLVVMGRKSEVDEKQE